jgi:hypothetical protein
MDSQCRQHLNAGIAEVGLALTVWGSHTDPKQNLDHHLVIGPGR